MWDNQIMTPTTTTHKKKLDIESSYYFAYVTWNAAYAKSIMST